MRLLRLAEAGVAKMQVDLRGLPADQQELRGSVMKGYNFTERSRKVLAIAREEAARLHHEYVGTEHILLGLIREGEGVAATVLQNLSVDLNELEQTINGAVKKGSSKPTVGPDLPYTSRAKKVLELAMDEAREVHHSYVGTEHLLMGLLREAKGIAAQVLIDAGVTVEAARAEMLRILGTEVPGSPPPQPTRHEFATIRSHSGPLPEFVERVRKIIADAHDIAADRKAFEVTPAHLALALLRHRDGVANAALSRLRFDRETALSALNDLAPVGTAEIWPDAALGLDPASAAVLQSMEKMQRLLRSQVAGTQHLLMALLSASPEVAAVFSSQGVKLVTVLNEILLIIG
jgi:ATP-dependent Clp protease ATP-binding subunit ClpA